MMEGAAGSIASDSCGFRFEGARNAPFFLTGAAATA
jgi:hypothetical protein